MNDSDQHPLGYIEDSECPTLLVQNGVIVSTSPAFLSLSGYSNSDKLIGKSAEDFISGQPISGHPGETTIRISDCTIVRPDGQPVQVEVFKIPINASNEPTFEVVVIDKHKLEKLDPHVLAFLERIHHYSKNIHQQLEATQQKLEAESINHDAAKGALSKSESRYRQIIELSPSGILILDKGVIQSANLSAGKLLGLNSSDELIGKDVISLFVPDCRPSIEKAIHTPSYFGRLPEDHRVVRSDGTEVDVEIYAAEYPAEPKGMSYMILRDISERKEAERALRLAEERSQFALDVSGIGVWDWQIDAHESYYSKTWKAMLGYEEGEILPTQEEWTSRVHPDDWPAIREAERKLFSGEAAIYECTYRLRAKDGNYKWILSRGKPISYDSTGKPSRYIGTHTDLTDRVHAEARIERLNRELSIRNAELENANHELETFTYTVSHDLRSPLRTIDGYSHAIEYDYGDELSEGTKEYLRSIRRATQNLGHLIDSLLSLSRINQSPLKRQTINLTMLTKEIVQDMIAMHSSRRLEFEVDPKMQVEGDRNLLVIVLQNLIGNAVKFTADRPVAKIHIGQRDNATFVSDNGVGFNMQHVGKLFEPFQRLHSTREYEGSGIGLATVDRIVRRHGGRIWAESEEGEGSTFYFTLSEAGD